MSASMDCAQLPSLTAIACLRWSFDFNQHKLLITTNEPAIRSMDLAPRTVADFYQEFMAALKSLKIDVKIWKMPVEIADPIAFDKDTVHASYDRAAVEKLWRILLSLDAVFKVFRSRFVGKSSPVHFFWGSFDLAVTRFSGRKAPPRNDPDPVLRKIMQEAYSHEVISAGWWPGTDELNGSAFYCYAAPEPKGFKEYKIRPAAGLLSRRQWASLCFPMTPSINRLHPALRFLISCRARTKPAPSPASGTATPWNSEEATRCGVA